MSDSAKPDLDQTPITRQERLDHDIERLRDTFQREGAIGAAKLILLSPAIPTAEDDKRIRRKRNPRPESDEPKRYAKGGIVPGAGSSDSVSAKLTPGEGILTTRAVALLGREFVDAANKAALLAQGRESYDTDGLRGLAELLLQKVGQRPETDFWLVDLLEAIAAAMRAENLRSS